MGPTFLSLPRVECAAPLPSEVLQLWLSGHRSSHRWGLQYRILTATAIQIICCTIPARGRQRSGILTIILSSAQLMAPRYGPVGAWWELPILTAMDIRTTCFTDPTQVRQRSGILTIILSWATHSAPHY